MTQHLPESADEAVNRIMDLLMVYGQNLDQFEVCCDREQCDERDARKLERERLQAETLRAAIKTVVRQYATMHTNTTLAVQTATRESGGIVGIYQQNSGSFERAKEKP